MNQLNSIILEGNVVRKAEFSEPATGFKVCKFPLAVNRKSKTPAGVTTEDVSYFDVETYGEMAESCFKWCDRGQGVRVVGRLKQSRWEENNVKKSRVYVVAEHVEYKFSKPKNEAGKEEKDKATEKTSEVLAAEASADKAEKASAQETAPAQDSAQAPAPATEEAVF